MTDAERNEIFAAKKKEIIDELVGEDVHIDFTGYETEKFIDFNWNSGKPFYDRPRILKNMNPRMKAYDGYYEHLRQNGYVDVTVETHDETLEQKESTSRKP